MSKTKSASNSGSLSIENLNISTRRRKGIHTRTRHSIVDGVSLRCRTGETLAILGASGSGKSTILSFISGRLQASPNYATSTTTLQWNGASLVPKDLGRLSYFIPCHSELLPFLNAIQSVTFEEGLRGASGRTKEDLEKVLVSVGLPLHCVSHSVNGYLTAPLTEAELRKLGLAMSVTANAEIVLFDEPTSYVSESNAVDILSFITSTTRSRGNVSIITLHQPTKQQLMQLDQVLILTRDGRCAYQGTPEQVYERIQSDSQDPDIAYIRDVLIGAPTIFHKASSSDESNSSQSLDDAFESNSRGKRMPVGSAACDRRAKHNAWLDNIDSTEHDAWSETDNDSKLMASQEGFQDEVRYTIAARSYSDWLTRSKLGTLLARTFFFRLQNPIVFASVTSVMVIMSLLFGLVFFGAGKTLSDGNINKEIVLPSLPELPTLSDELLQFGSNWAEALTEGVGPYARQPLQEGIFPASPPSKDSDFAVMTPFDESTSSGGVQQALDTLMDVIYCSTHYWRIVDRWSDDYREVIPGTYTAMFAQNTDLDGMVIPQVPASSLFEAPMDKMALTIHDITLLGDYLLDRSGMLHTIDICLQRNDNVLFWLCARSLLKQFDGLLACGGLPPFNPEHDMTSPWQTPEEDNSTSSSDVNTSVENAPSTTVNVDSTELSPVQKLLSPLMGGISLGAGMVFILAVVAFGMFPIIINYWLERESANRDTIARSYSTITFFVAKTLADFLFEMIPTLILSIIFCALLGLAGYEFFAVQIMVIGTAWAHGGTAYLFTALSRKRGTAMGLFSGWTFISLLFSGFMLRTGDMPDWCGWWRFISALYWAYGGCMCVFFKPIKGLSISNFILVALGVTDDAQTSLITCLGALFAIGLGVRILACLSQMTLHRDIGTQSDYYSL